MIQVFIFIMILVLLSWLQNRYFMRLQNKKEWSIFIVMMCIVAVTGTSLILSMTPPSLATGLEYIFQSLGQFILH